MYAYSLDAKHLIFHDAFGLTRVVFAKKPKAKTNGKEPATPRTGRVSINRSGDMVLTGRHVWVKTTLWSVPSMKPVKRFARFEKRDAILHPDGTHLLYIPEGTTTLVLEAYPGGQTTEFELGAPDDEDFGEDEWVSRPNLLVTSPDGSFAALAGRMLVGGTIAEQRVQITDRRPITTHGELGLFATSAGPAAVTHDAGTSTVYAPGADTFTLESLTPAQIAGDWVAWQPDVSTIARRPLSGGDDERFALEGDDAGLALVMPGIDALCVVPWHREDVLDLLGGQRTSRKLDSMRVKERRAFLELVHPYMLAASELSLTVEWAKVEFKLASHHELNTSTFYSGSFGGKEEVALKALEGAQNGFKAGFYAMSGRSTSSAFAQTQSDVFGVDDLNDAFAWLDAHGFADADLSSAFEYRTLDDDARALLESKRS